MAHMYPYLDAFGLRDNPFGPTRLDDVPPTLLQRLETRPLRVHEHEGLLQLFVDEAGPFGEHLAEFKFRLELEDYSSDPASLGRQSFAFLICGPRGSGKSTLVNRMILWLLSCAGEQGHVRVVRFPHPEPMAAWQCHDLRPNVKEYLGRFPGDHGCVVVNDLDTDCQPDALSLCDELFEERVAVVFLITSDPRLMDDLADDARVQVRRFPTGALTPDQAVAFVRRRIELFREEAEHQPEWLLDVLGRWPLFPVDEEDVRKAVSDRHDAPAPITLRGLGSALRNALVDRLVERRRIGIAAHDTAPISLSDSVRRRLEAF